MYKYAIVGLWLIVCACTSNKDETNSTVPTLLSIKVENPKEAEAFLFESAPYTTAAEWYGCIDTALLQSDGKLLFNFGLASQGFYILRFGDSARLGGSEYVLFLQPGDTLLLEADRSDSLLNFKVTGGNNPRYLSYLSAERNMMELDPVTAGRAQTMLQLSPIDAGQINNSLKVQGAQFFKGYFSGSSVDGEFERYVIRRNDYAHAVRALRYVFDSPKRSVTNTRIVYTEPSFFYYTDHVSSSDHYLLFTQQFRQYAFLTKWLATHQELAVDSDSVFRERALRHFTELVLKTDKGELLASNLFQARSIIPQVRASEQFFESLEYLQKSLNFDSTGSTFAASMRAYCDAYMMLKPGKALPSFEAESLNGARITSEELSGMLILYRDAGQWPRIHALLPANTPVTALYLAQDQTDVAEWRRELLPSEAAGIQHAVAFGDAASAVARDYQLSDRYQCYSTTKGVMRKPFLLLDRKGFVPDYLP